MWGWSWLDRGWVPHDEGALAQSAERVLRGEIPHVDFDEIYTGALTYAHALAFEVFGVRLVSLRYLLFAAFILWIPLVWYVARRFLPPWHSGLVTLLAVALSIPNYSASLPSWYLLFLATLAIAAMLRFLDTRGRRWLLVAGLAAGASILMKIVGVYLLVALCVWLVFLEQEEDEVDRSGPRGRTYSLVLTVAAVLLAAGPALLVRGFAGASQTVHFVLPSAALAAYLVVNEWRVSRGALAARVRRMATPVSALALGTAIPLLAFTWLYAAGPGLGALYEGVFLSPQSRFQYATARPPGLDTAVWTAVPALMLVWAHRGKVPGRTLGLLAVLLGLVLLVSREGEVYRAVWHSMRWWIPALVLAGTAALFARGRRGAPLPDRDRALFGLLSVAAFTGLVQFPFSAPIYFLYVAPLALLALTALAGPSERARPMLALLVGFHLVFVVARVTPGFIHVMGRAAFVDRYTERLALDRGQILVTPEERSGYERLVRTIDAHAPEGVLWAGPDSPEVYFLSGRANPTRYIFDFLGDGPRGDEFLSMLEREDVRMVVVNRSPGFSAPLSAETEAGIARRYPARATIGRFDAYWRP